MEGLLRMNQRHKITFIKNSLRVLATLVCLFATQVLAAEEFSGKVVGVTDGDTIKVLRQGRQVKVRLYGIDAPERKQAYGKKARRFVADLVAGKVVTIRVRNRDRYKRIVGEVLLPDGRSLNQELVRAGYAWWYKRYAKKDWALALIEMEARKGKKGLWAEPNPIPPWKFRRRRRR